MVFPARANTAQTFAWAVALIDADDGNDRFLACMSMREWKLRDIVVHSKIGIVDDRWLTLGSATSTHSLLNDIEMNIVRPRRADRT